MSRWTAFRWLAPALAVMLAGCASSGYYYDDGYYATRDGHYARYDDGYGDDGYYGDGYGYASGGHGHGDYYYGSGYVGGYASWQAWPAYYSVFWPINRWYVDPWYHPGFYYGVTFFPRHYYGYGLSSWYGHRWYPRSYLAYSPYRHSWVDHYYDWTPYYRGHRDYRDHYPIARYGSARNEAERLARLTGADRYYRSAARDGGLPVSRAAVSAREPATGPRGASYRGSDAARRLPSTRGFGTPVREAAPARDRGASLERGRAAVPTRQPATRSGDAARELAREPAYRGTTERPARTAPPARDPGSAPLRGARPEPVTRSAPRTPVAREPATVDRGRSYRRAPVEPQRRAYAPAERISVPQRQLSPAATTRGGVTVPRAAPTPRSAQGYAPPARQSAPPRAAPAPRSAPSYAPAPRSAPAPRPAPARSAPPPSRESSSSGRGEASRFSRSRDD